MIFSTLCCLAMLETGRCGAQIRIPGFALMHQLCRKLKEKKNPSSTSHSSLGYNVKSMTTWCYNGEQRELIMSHMIGKRPEDIQAPKANRCKTSKKLTAYNSYSHRSVLAKLKIKKNQYQSQKILGSENCQHYNPGNIVHSKGNKRAREVQCKKLPCCHPVSADSKTPTASIPTDLLHPFTFCSFPALTILCTKAHGGEIMSTLQLAPVTVLQPSWPCTHCLSFRKALTLGSN